MIDATDIAQQIENAEAADPIEPTERIDPIEPIDNTEPFEAIDSSESSDQRDHLEAPADGSTPQILISGAARYTTESQGASASFRPGEEFWRVHASATSASGTVSTSMRSSPGAACCSSQSYATACRGRCPDVRMADDRERLATDSRRPELHRLGG
jgi:hypothetical protein